MPDLEAAAAHPPGRVDSTVATPVICARSSTARTSSSTAATKYLAGHHDALVGALVHARPALHERLAHFRHLTGSVCAPDVAWLLLRGMKTLRVRVERQTETARILADRLRSHPGVETVRYPGIGGLVSFDSRRERSNRRALYSSDQECNLASAARRPRWSRGIAGRATACR